MDYEYFKDLSRTASGKAFNIYKNLKHDRYQCGKTKLGNTKSKKSKAFIHILIFSF